jgi:predicted Fe-Mo cluster-binding NifX family protein
MRIAISISDGRISPVFDVARRLLVVDVDDRHELSRVDNVLEDVELTSQARRVADLGVDVLICGAVSLPLEKMLLAAGVDVMSRRCGEAEQVLNAFIAGELTEQLFLMPGCCGRLRSTDARAERVSPRQSERGRRRCRRGAVEPGKADDESRNRKR